MAETQRCCRARAIFIYLVKNMLIEFNGHESAPHMQVSAKFPGRNKCQTNFQTNRKLSDKLSDKLKTVRQTFRQTENCQTNFQTNRKLSDKLSVKFPDGARATNVQTNSRVTSDAGSLQRRLASIATQSIPFSSSNPGMLTDFQLGLLMEVELTLR